MKSIYPHIRIFSKRSYTVLQVDTWELKDFVEDYLTEGCGITYEYFQIIEPKLKETNRESYNLYYSDDYTCEQIERVVLKLDKQRLQGIVDFQLIQANGMFYCPCCGYNTLGEAPTGTYEICDVCFWEDDPIQRNDPKYRGGANRVSLMEGQVNYEKYGACDKEVVKRSRGLAGESIRNPNWKILE